MATFGAGLAGASFLASFTGPDGPKNETRQHYTQSISGCAKFAMDRTATEITDENTMMCGKGG
jgi:hypothetical protein